MRVYLCGFDIGMAHQLLNHPDIDPVFQQMRGERMPKRMATDPFGDAGFIHRRFYCFLQTGFKNVVTSGGFTARVLAPLRIPHVKNIAIHIQVLHPQADTFHEAKSAAVKYFGHEQVCSCHMSHYAPNFRLRHNRWRTHMSSGFNRFELIFNRLVQYVAV